ncbi:hypothetical protein BX616_010349 [Lobosporangium transversale]|uniref:TLC domain-domain-containing protein n=1 Tax=Lobosporangium transversale TaxID=64571 RepID=A0A1Y2GJY4_9FUNG|nr:hypothetical protein BCR41DRAFT_356040 [Lobosporangium transversale]KAF9912322.1 hypothetical protein BX616_010349 [Lobosporangium transversale]ORZ13009.1 hypothetical protein BCR41DRAFT_356040 [Lobosporangium transversale]|eukprot:XP_021880358.1 hypothetical protein BCR41DRAFT_356040 [Lobosporangium transversale]
MTGLAFSHQESKQMTIGTADPASYGYFLGVKKTPPNILFGQAIVVSFILQFIIFYTTWFFCPSFTKYRRGLSWSLALFCAIIMSFITLFEFGYLRTTLWSLLGWEQQGPEAATATIFTYWAPTFHGWVFELGRQGPSAVTLASIRSSLSSLELFTCLFLDGQTYKDLAGGYLRWLITLPIFSLAPLKQPQLYSSTAPYYLGGGGRLLFSLENFPRETWPSSVLCGYFIGYCIADLLLGNIHYRMYVDAMGWTHHITYCLLVYRLAIQNNLSQFLICGGVLEVPSIFLASGMMFPRLRSDFWFPLTFVLFRIFFVGFIWHECAFNYPTPPRGAAIYFVALIIHCFWLSKYIRGRSRRKQRAMKEAEAGLSTTPSFSVQKA